MRTMYGRYREYHTSLDNKDLISFGTIVETIDLYYDVLKTIDENRTYLASVQKGTPQFSKSPISVYPSTMNTNFFNQRNIEFNMMLELVNLSDGNHDLLTVAEKRNFRMVDILPIKDKLVEAGYLQETVKKTTNN